MRPLVLIFVVILVKRFPAIIDSAWKSAHCKQ